MPSSKDGSADIFAYVIIVVGAIVAFYLALAFVIRLLLAFVAPAFIYLPVRIAMGASALPPHGSPAYSHLSPKSSADLAATLIFLSLLSGAGFAVGVGVLFGGIITLFSLVGLFFNMQISSSISELILPFMAAAFCFGIGMAAINDVRTERAQQ